MKIEGLRWGDDFGGMACGPVEGSTLVQLTVVDEGKPMFLLCSRYECYENVEIAPVPLFDLCSLLGLSEVDAECMVETINSVCTERFDYDLSEMDEEVAEKMRSSRYAAAIRFVCNAMNAYVQNPDALAETYIAALLGENLNKLDIPEPENPFAEEDEEWDEEEEEEGEEE